VPGPRLKDLGPATERRAACGAKRLANGALPEGLPAFRSGEAERQLPDDRHLSMAETRAVTAEQTLWGEWGKTAGCDRGACRCWPAEITVARE